MTRKRCKAVMKGGKRCDYDARIDGLCLPHFLVEYDGGKINRAEDDKNDESDTQVQD